MIDVFLDGLCKESDHEFRGLSHLLASLPDPSLSQGQVEAVPVTVARERGVIPEASNETLQAFSFSEMKLYKHAIAYKWTAEELITTIKLIKSTDFKVEDVDVDLHKRVAAAIAQGHFCKAEVCYIRSKLCDILELYMSYTRFRNGIF